jgi:hypothetical protein
MSIEQLFEEKQQFHNIDDLIQKAAANNGELSGIAISEDKVVKEAEVLGLIKVREADGWSMHDTIHLTPRSRLTAGLPPIVRRPSVVSTAAHVALAFVAKLFGMKKPHS